MIHKSNESIPSFIAGDKTLLKEVLHPKNDNIPLAYSLAQASINVGESSLPHQLKGSEVYYFLEGNGEIVVNKDKKSVKKGDVVFVPSNAEQYVVNSGNRNLVFLCIVSPPWDEQEETIF